MKSIVLLTLAQLVIVSVAYNQTINAYAQVTAITGTTLTLANINETFHSFNVGEKIMIMQMQDDVIGTNTGNNANFGDIANIKSAGLYEISVIQSRPNANTLVLSSLTNTYNICNNCRVQVISFRKLGNPHFTTTANITGLPWNGNIGGVIAFEVEGTLVLNHNILANGIGFRGGIKSNNWTTPPGCRDTPYIANNANYGFKGEGIYRVTNNNYRNCRGKVANGGGGGNDHNGGGGGGGNFTQGGLGGFGWNSGNTCPNSAGGLGGLSLSIYINVNRVFMGGGGGGGQQNNDVGTSGGNGGGIIYIKAQAIQTNNTGTRYISANGISTANGGNDATGGGGAGGTIILDIPFYQISSNSPLYVQTNGGNTGNVGHAEYHGAGGAGAKGPIFFYTFSQPQNVYPEANNGTPGCNNNVTPCQYTGGPATPGDAIFYLGNNVILPTVQILLSASQKNSFAEISWKLFQPINHANQFILLKSYNSIDWNAIYQTDYHAHQLVYNYQEELPSNNNVVYYQVLMIDYNGDFHYSNVVNLSQNTINIRIYPNPFHEQLTLHTTTGIQSLKIIDVQGRVVYQENNLNTSQKQFNTESLPPGIYFLEIFSDNLHEIKKVVKQ